MSKWPSVTVIILHYNGFDLTINCVKSVLKSTYPNFDILIVDNGSTDNSYKKLLNKYKKNKKIKIISAKKNLFFTGGFNFGAKKSKGDKIVLLSNDIIVDPLWIDELMVLLRQNKKYIVQPKILKFYKKNVIDNVGGRYSFSGFGMGIGGGEIDRGQYDRNSMLDYTSATTLALDRKFFLRLGGYDKWFWSHSEDVDLSLRAKKAGGKCLLCYKAKIYHIGSVTYKKYVPNPEILFHIRKNRIRVILKNYSGIEMIVRLLIVLTENFFFFFQDLLSFNSKRLFVTVRSTYAAFFK